MHVALKTAVLFWWYDFNKSNFQKIFEGEMLTEIQPATLLQIFSEFTINSKVIMNSIKGPDDTCQEVPKMFKFKGHVKGQSSTLQKHV